MKSLPYEATRTSYYMRREVEGTAYTCSPVACGTDQSLYGTPFSRVSADVSVSIKRER